MWIEFIVKDAAAETVYFKIAGLLDDNGDSRNHHSQLVADGQVEEDTSLTLFTGIAYDESGNETPFFWEASSNGNQRDWPFKSHTENYKIQTPAQPGQLAISFRLRFRSFPPYLFRSIGKADLVSELIVFDMETFQKNILICELNKAKWVIMKKIILIMAVYVFPSLSSSHKNLCFRHKTNPFPIQNIDGSDYALPLTGRMNRPVHQFVDIDGDENPDLFVQEPRLSIDIFSEYRFTNGL